MRIGKYKIIDILNPVKWKRAVIGYILNKYSPELQPHIVEQLYYRIKRCRQCVEYGECIGRGDCQGCGCHTWNKMLIHEERCECHMWGPIMNKTNWEQFKIKNNDFFQGF